MKLKLVEREGKTYAEVMDGKPIVIDDDGNEIAFDIERTRGAISRLSAEAKGHRERAEAAEKIVKAFEGVDPAAARKALETVANLDAKKLIDAGEVERVKGEISSAFQEKLAAAEKRAESAEGALYSEKIGGSFARSKFIADKIAVPADMIQATFGKSFKVEDGKTVALDANGQKIYSRANPGELAPFDEALEILVSAYPYKEHILKGTGGNGAGQKPGSVPGSKVITTAELNKMAPKERASFMTSGGKLSD